MSVFIGHNPETEESVSLPLESMFQSTYIIGRTGMGKSALIASMVLQQAYSRQSGLCLIDPHGELVDAVLRHLPADRDDVILLDASDSQYPFGINLFDCRDPSDPVLVSRTADQVVGIFRKIWGDAWGARLEDLLRNIAHTMIEAPGMTMHEVPRLLYDGQFRRQVMSSVTNPVVLDFWQYEYNAMNPRDQQDFRASTTNRVRAFLSNPLVRHIVGQTGTTVDVPRAMDTGMIVLVKLPVGIIGEDATSLIGSVIVRELLQAAMTRGTTGLPFMIYADEYHRFATPDFATLIEESRKYRVGTILSHQRRDQLLESHRSVPLSAVNLITLQVLGTEAGELAMNFDAQPPERQIISERPVRAPIPDPLDHMIRYSHPDPYLAGAIIRIEDYLRELERSVRNEYGTVYPQNQIERLTSERMDEVKRNISRLIFRAMTATDMDEWGNYRELDYSDKQINRAVESVETFTPRGENLTGVLDLTKPNEATQADLDHRRGVIVNLAIELIMFCRTIAGKPIMGNTGQIEPVYEMEASTRDVRDKIANSLATLPPYTARVRLRGKTGMEEATIKTALHNLPETHMTDRVISRSRNDYASEVSQVIEEIETRGRLESPPEVYEDREPPAKRKVQIRRSEPL